MFVPSRLRNSAFAALVIAAAGCSEAAETVLRTRDVDDGAAPPTLELGKCAGANTHCEGIPEVQAYAPGPAVSCTDDDLGLGTILWTYSTTSIDCPDPPCTVRFAQVYPRDDAGLDVIGSIDVPNVPGMAQTGIWFGSFDASGALSDSKIPVFALPSRVSQPKFYVLGGRDAARNTFAVERAGDINVATSFDDRVLRIDHEGGSPIELTNLLHVPPTVTMAVAPDGGFALKVTWFNDGFSENESLRPDGSPQEIDISRYDATGRFLWNQTKLTRAMPLTSATLLGFDHAGNLVVMLERALGNDGYADSPRTEDGAYFGFFAHRLAKIDPDGNPLWVDDLPKGTGVASTLAADGAVYLIHHEMESVGDGRWKAKPPVLERIEPSGRSVWTRELEHDGFLSTDADGSALLAYGNLPDRPTHSFHLISRDGEQCGHFEVPCPSDDAQCSMEEVRGGPQTSLYFSIGRATRPQ